MTPTHRQQRLPRRSTGQAGRAQAPASAGLDTAHDADAASESAHDAGPQAAPDAEDEAHGPEPEKGWLTRPVRCRLGQDRMVQIPAGRCLIRQSAGQVQITWFSGGLTRNVLTSPEQLQRLRAASVLLHHDPG